MGKSFMLAGLCLLLLPGAIPLVAGECPEIESSLRFALHKNFPAYEIAQDDLVSEQKQQKGETINPDKCSYILKVATSVYVLLLKAKESSEYLAVLALSPKLNESGEWLVEQLDTYDNDMPVLKKARGGFYSDIATKKMLTVTRDSSAVHVQCMDSGNQFVYKILHDGGFKRCRVK